MKKENYIIYGAGEHGKGCLEFLKSKDLDSCIIGFCDKRYKEIKGVLGKPVYSYEEAKNIGAPFIIAVSGEKESVCQLLEKDGQEYCALDEFAKDLCMSKTEFNREFCAFFHIKNMEDYFSKAEDGLGMFWAMDSVFYRMFAELDLSNVIELACGRGRHVTQYVNEADHIVLVDILQNNINFCKNRFSEYENISYYCNNGYNLKELSDDTYTSLFCYDAMVHFEMMDIYEYLQDIYRVLKKGGKALIHHSNSDDDYRASFEFGKNGRSFMSKNIFAYMAYRVGFKVISQEVIDWGYKDLDCVSLIQK